MSAFVSCAVDESVCPCPQVVFDGHLAPSHACPRHRFRPALAFSALAAEWGG